MKLIISALLSALILWVGHSSPAKLNNSVDSLKKQTVQAKVNEIPTDISQVPSPQLSNATEPEMVAETINAPQPISHPIGCENYRHLIEQYDWNVETLLKISEAESGCNPSQVGDQRTIRGIYAPSCGLFQIRTLKSRPSCEALKDPATNIAWAYRIYQGQGYKAWSVCKTKVRCI